MDCYDSRWRVPSLLLIPLLICVGLLFFVDVFQFQYYTMTPTKMHMPELIVHKQLELNGFLIKTPGCRIPYMDPFDKSVKKFIEEPKVPKCNNGTPPLFDSNLTSLFLINSSLAAYNVEDLDELSCCYSPVQRKVPKKKSADSVVEVGINCVNINVTNEILITDEFIRVTCTYENSSIYKDFFAFIPVKTDKNVSARLKNFTSVPLNILVIGLDAVSRVNFHRQMPKTAKYLADLKAIELLGYNKVGDNTFPNLIPVLTGMFENELTNSCWPKSNNYFDDCPFIWKDYKLNGYTTAFGEDSTWMGIFNYNRKGFHNQPTDYCYGYFNRISEKQIGNSHNMNVFECIGARDIYKAFLDYIKMYSTRMQAEKLPYFGFFWGASLSHDYLNKPHLGDEYYKSFFQSLKVDGLLDNTAVVFMSDHGIRWGGIRQTYQGRMEERLPFVYMLLPQKFQNTYPKAYGNLQKNVRRLTTPFDLHETLKDLLHPQNLTNEYLQELGKQKSRGYTLFSDISGRRTCEDAGIDSHWCTCQQSFEMDKNDSIILESAHFAVDYMNYELQGYAQCANLTLEEVKDARMMSHGDHILNGNSNSKDYMLTIRTLPGDGIFEVTIRNEKIDNVIHFNVTGTISRLNLYGKQSSCITDFHLKLYCYCKTLF